MCTVTYIPATNGFYLTSSRDEKAGRATIPPAKYQIEGIDLIYPKDELAGGTWIASNLNGRTVCLLNGAFLNHVKQDRYVRSRGLVLLESFKYKNAYEFSNAVNLNDVEPFTMISLNYLSVNPIAFTEFRWDGKNKHLIALDTSERQIWSSATLYSPHVQLVRAELFKVWTKQFSHHEDCNILNFHCRKHGLHSSDDILMKGADDLMTLSITQVACRNGKSALSYFDILNNRIYTSELLKAQEINV
ncbi:NRDE family protein [Elizabethkingia anophelis]|uniref:NRDE family protein n=1 Tax=Elizabethkingia anophelis TaxID=1117645 RepID=UPI0016243902|nr:NRDE family protein [Elizabethkingia anophelis]MDV4116278.1 hypothetical protein [Elizabethkingia anophelis]